MRTIWVVLALAVLGAGMPAGAVIAHPAADAQLPEQEQKKKKKKKIDKKKK